MALQFKRGRDAKPEGIHLKFLVYGHSGAGKTWLAASAKNPIILLTERNGEQSVRLSNPDAPYAIVSNIEEVRDFLRAAQSGVFAEQGIDTIVVDGLTEIQRLFKDEMIAEKGGDTEFTFAMWSDLTEKMRRMLRMLRDLPLHVVCTALAETEMEGEIRHIFPAFQGRKLFDEVMQYFNAVGYVFKRGGDGDKPQQHFVMFDGPSRYSVKNAHPLRGTRTAPISEWIDEMVGAEMKPKAEPEGEPNPEPEGEPEAKGEAKGEAKETKPKTGVRRTRRTQKGEEADPAGDERDPSAAG